MNWNAEAEALLVRLWDLGLSMGDIAEAMRRDGYPVPSRSAVSGRINMLRVRGVKVSPRPRFVPYRMNGTRYPVTHDNGVDYLALSEAGCKAILDKRGGRFNLPMCCGKRRLDGEPYCPEHLRQYTHQGIRR